MLHHQCVSPVNLLSHKLIFVWYHSVSKIIQNGSVNKLSDQTAHLAIHFRQVRIEMLSIEMIHTVVRSRFGCLQVNGAFSDWFLAKEDEKIGTYVAACSELVYTTKYSLIRVGSDVKQSGNITGQEI